MERKRKRTSITPVVVVETPTKKPAETKVYDTRSSAKKRRELDAAQEESTPVRRGLRTEPEASPYAFRTKTRKGDAIADAGPDEPLSEIVVSPNIIEAKFEASPPPPSKRRKVTRKSESVSPHFPTPTPSEDGPKRTRTRKGSITSPYFSGATETKGTGRAPKGVSIMPWPPFSSDKFGLVQEELLENPVSHLSALSVIQ
jgi:hypothetical protein